VRYTAWRRAFERATGELGLEGVTSHDLRHFYASALIAGGQSVKVVQTALGHSSAAVTLRVYAHLWPGDEDRSRALIDLALTEDSRTGDFLGTLGAS
jgi:integrase